MNKTPLHKVAVRYPPSPTGNLHIGNIRSILFNYLFAKHAELAGTTAEMYMRFEDTDKERSKKEFEAVALDALEGLGITYTHGPYRQSERGELYTAAIAQLITQGDAYKGEESKDGSGEKVIRFKNPNKQLTFTDAVRGDITIDTTDFGDFAIARSLESPLYHLTVVVDDIDMDITHVIRGEDHITSTPRQMLLIEALGGTAPHYAHLPLIIGSDKKKLGKRHGAVTYQDFIAQGYLPEAIINYLALLGWSAGDDREFYTLEELIETFTLEGVHKAPAMFSYDKLDSINRHYLLNITKDDFSKEVLKHVSNSVKSFLTHADELVKDVILHTIIKERINKWRDIINVCDSELSWLSSPAELDTQKLVWKKSTKEATAKHLHSIITLLEAVAEEAWATASDSKSDDNPIKAALWDYATEAGRGDVLWPMRYALTGQERSPDPFIVSFILGKSASIDRLKAAVQKLEA